MAARDVAMRGLRRLIRNIVTGGVGFPVLLSVAIALVAASATVIRSDPEVAILVGVAIFALVLGLLLVGRLVLVSEDFAQESLRQDRIAQGLQLLYREFEPRLPLPPVQGWALDPRTLVLMIRTMRARRPEVVVEFGSGLSTLVLGQVAHEIGARLYSFEHDVEWFQRVRAWVSQWELADTVLVQHAPLQYDGSNGRRWYDRHVVAETLPRAGVGLALVDGPPHTAGHLMRAGALPAVFERAAEEITVVMDDCERADEKKIVSDWCAAHPQVRLELVSFEHDIAILTNLPRGRPWLRHD